MENISVFLSEWQVLFREGMHFILSGEEDFEVIGEATDNEEALNFMEKHPPVVAILNASQDKPSGIEITRHIKQSLAPVAIILVTDNHNDKQLFSAMKSGANACLSKDMSPDELVDTIRKVAQGDYPISEALLIPEIASRVVGEFEASALLIKETGNLPDHLLPAEAEILRRIAGRSPVKEITRALNINEAAIRHNLDLILPKLVASGRSREAIKAAQNNLPPVISKISIAEKTGEPITDYVTRDEFSSFKETLIERLKSFIGEPT